jgi:hypothetical protein
MTTREKAVAVCGMDCFHCELYGDNLTDDMKRSLAAMMKVNTDEVQACKGCREQKGCLIHPVCSTYDCVKDKKVSFCYECDDFPCTFLLPAADRAEKLPHNLKVYNLCRIRSLGLKKWIEEESAISRQKYYKGKIVIGAGPQLQ